jgi:hypothetical protein
LPSKEETRSSNERTIGDVAYWPFAAFRRYAAIALHSMRSGQETNAALGRPFDDTRFFGKAMQNGIAGIPNPAS